MIPRALPRGHWHALGTCWPTAAEAREHARRTLASLRPERLPHGAELDEAVRRCPSPHACTLTAPDHARSA